LQCMHTQTHRENKMAQDGEGRGGESESLPSLVGSNPSDSCSSYHGYACVGLPSLQEVDDEFFDLPDLVDVEGDESKAGVDYDFCTYYDCKGIPSRAIVWRDAETGRVSRRLLPIRAIVSSDAKTGRVSRRLLLETYRDPGAGVFKMVAN
jgi:hypothetical protein